MTSDLLMFQKVISKNIVSTRLDILIATRVIVTMVNSKVSIVPFTLHIKVGCIGTVKGFRSLLLISSTTLRKLPSYACRLLISSCRQTDI